MSVGEQIQFRPAAARNVVSWTGFRRLPFRRLGPALAPALILGGFVLASILAPLLAPYDPNALDMANALTGPSWEHPLGTDQLGRDMLTRLIFGGRLTLTLSAVSTVGIVGLGLLFGVIAGYVGGRVDLAISTLLTVLLALPSLLLTLAILGILGWAVFSGQFEDLEQEGLRILQKDDGKPNQILEKGQD